MIHLYNVTIMKSLKGRYRLAHLLRSTGQTSPLEDFTWALGRAHKIVEATFPAPILDVSAEKAGLHRSTFAMTGID